MTDASVPGRVRPASASEPELGKFRVLAIDGGGIRGVIPAVLLADLEALLGSALASVRSDPAQVSSAALWEGISEPRIADCFHLIAGTSTGGLLAAGLTNAGTDRRPKLSAAEAVDAYKSHGKEIFHRSLLQSLLNPLNLLRPKYPLAQLRKVLEIRTVLGAGRLEDARTGVLIASYDLSVPGPRLFTRWGAPGAGTTPAAPEETMVQAGLATAAAPTYFDPEKLGVSRLVDGGIYAGNPALAAISMALRRTEEPRPLDPSEILLVSLGTGVWEQPLDPGWGGIIGWLRPRKGREPLLEALLGGQADFATEAAHMILNGWSETSLPGADPTGPAGPWWDPNLPPASVGGGPRFWRYQAALPEPWALDDVSKLSQLTDIGAAMTERYRNELERLAALLVRAGPVPR